MALSPRWPWDFERRHCDRRQCRPRGRSSTDIGRGFVSLPGLILAVLGLGLVTASPVRAEVVTPLKKALKSLFREARQWETFSLDLSPEDLKAVAASAGVSPEDLRPERWRWHVGKTDTKIVGYALEDTVEGKWGPIHFLVGLSPSGKIVRVMVLDYDEIRGRPVAKKRFLKQYRGKHAGSDLKLHRDIQGISGATISSRSLTEGVRVMVHAFHWARQNQKRPQVP